MDAAPSVSPVSLPLTLEATGTVLTGLGHCLRLSALLSFDTKEKAGQALAGCRGITIPLRLSGVGGSWLTSAVSWLGRMALACPRAHSVLKPPSSLAAATGSHPSPHRPRCSLHPTLRRAGGGPSPHSLELTFRDCPLGAGGSL